MNQRRVVGILQELATASARVSALQAELADAMAETEQRRKPRARKRVEPAAQPSDNAMKDMRRALRGQGVRA